MASKSLCVVDTSAWIEYLTGSALGKQLAPHFPKQATCIVPTLVQLELAKWLRREADEDRADQVIAYTMECLVIPLDTGIALLAADMHNQYKLTTADAVVYATAQSKGAALLTCDAHFAKLADVSYWPKKSTHH